MQTLEKPLKTVELEESRRSSTCQPGIFSIKYSDMLLVDPSQPTINGESTETGLLNFGGLTNSGTRSWCWDAVYMSQVGESLSPVSRNLS